MCCERQAIARDPNLTMASFILMIVGFIIIPLLAPMLFDRFEPKRRITPEQHAAQMRKSAETEVGLNLFWAVVVILFFVFSIFGMLFVRYDHAPGGSGPARFGYGDEH